MAELVELLAASAKEVLDVEEVLPVHSPRIVMELRRDNGFDGPSLFGGFGASGAEKCPVQS